MICKILSARRIIRFIAYKNKLTEWTSFKLMSLPFCPLRILNTLNCCSDIPKGLRNIFRPSENFALNSGRQPWHVRVTVNSCEPTARVQCSGTGTKILIYEVNWIIKLFDFQSFLPATFWQLHLVCVRMLTNTTFLGQVINATGPRLEKRQMFLLTITVSFPNPMIKFDFR